jgi:hypothetical protein
MKREPVKASLIGCKELSKKEYELRLKRKKLQRELGIEIIYDSSNQHLIKYNDSERFSKYYESELEYKKDKAIANGMIVNDIELPKELYEKLLYTKKELESRK